MLLRSGSVLAAGEASPGVDERLAQRPVRGLVLAEPVLLGEPFDARSPSPSDRVREPRLRRAEDRETDDEEDAATATPSATCPGSGAGASSTAQRQPLMTAVIGLSARTHCHFTGIGSTAYMTPESSGRTCRKTGIM